MDTEPLEDATCGIHGLPLIDPERGEPEPPSVPDHLEYDFSSEPLTRWNLFVHTVKSIPLNDRGVWCRSWSDVRLNVYGYGLSMDNGLRLNGCAAETTKEKTPSAIESVN